MDTRVVVGFDVFGVSGGGEPVDLNPAQAEQAVDEDLGAFSTHFQALGNDPLTKFEAAAIKTYIFWKLYGARDAKPSSPAAGT